MKPYNFLMFTLFAILAIVAMCVDALLPAANPDAVLASGALAAAMLFNPANFSTWRAKVNSFILSKKLNPDDYPTEWRQLRAEVTITQNSIFRFLLKEDPNAVKNREVRLGLNDVFFGFAGRLAIIDETLATPFNVVPATSAIVVGHNVFYETGTIRLGSGSVSVWDKQPVSQYKYNPNSQTAISDNDGASPCYPVPILSGRNDIQMVMEIGEPGTIAHATPLTNRYVLQYTFYGFNVAGLAKDIETTPLY